MGTPREYGFNDISKENILKADPLSLFFSRPRYSDPLLAGKLFSVREEGAATQAQNVQFGSGGQPDHAGLQLRKSLSELMYHVWMKVGCYPQSWSA